MLPRVPRHLQAGLDFERLYDAFGGKLTHWQDYVDDYGESDTRSILCFEAHTSACISSF